jgi:lipoate-protein ligase A
MGKVAGTPRVFQSYRWRLLVDEPRDGPTNMAIDEALALGCDQGWSPPTVRVYRWALPTVSLGVNQSIEGEVNLSACRERRIPVVRRPTGGRAVLHHRELTYGLAIPVLPGSRSVLHDYRWISQCLLLTVQRLGVEATLSRGDHSQGEAGGVCFLSSARYEVTVNGRKLIGSAQRRLSRALLQHGSLLIDLEHTLWSALFPEGRELESRATALSLLLGRSPGWEELVEALRAGFESGAGVTLEPGGLTDKEESVVQELVVKRYGTTEWTLRR